MKLTISINDDLMKEIESYCKENYIAKSTFLSMTANEYLKQYKVVKALLNMNKSLELIAIKENPTKKDLQNLKEMQVLIKLLTEENK